MSDLPRGVDAGVRAAGDREVRGDAQERGQGLLEFAADGALAWLAGPAVEIGAVVGDVQP